MSRPTFHFVPEALWQAAPPDAPYVAASLDHEGYIHCTDGVENLGATFDRYFLGVPGAFMVLTVDLDSLDVPWRYDVPGSPYPHVYGPIRREAILAVDRVIRGADGRLEGLYRS